MTTLRNKPCTCDLNSVYFIYRWCFNLTMPLGNTFYRVWDLWDLLTIISNNFCLIWTVSLRHNIKTVKLHRALVVSLKFMWRKTPLICTHKFHSQKCIHQISWNATTNEARQFIYLCINNKYYRILIKYSRTRSPLGANVWCCSL